MRPRLYGLYFSIITTLLLAAIGGAICLLLVDYDTLINSIVATVHKNGLSQKLRNGVFTHNRFILLQRIAWLVFLTAPVCFWLAIRYRASITGSINFLLIAAWQSITGAVGILKKNTLAQNRQLVLLMVVIAFFFSCRIITAMLTYDEMWSYNYYTANHFAYSFFTYSNYPLFEISTHFFKWLPFSMKINLRLSSFIVGLAACLLLYSCLRKYFNSHFTAMAGLAAFAFTPLTVVFMASARGVMHEVFFAIAGIFSFLFWAAQPHCKKYMAVYLLAAVLGVYAMPTHVLLLLFILLMGWFMPGKRDWTNTRLFMKINLGILVGILLLYTPMVLATGSAVFADFIRKGPSYYEVILRLPNVMRNIFMGYTGYSYISVAMFIAALTMLGLVRKNIPSKDKLIAVFAIGLPVSAIVFYMVTTFPYAGRSLAYGALSIPLLVCLFVQMARPWLQKNKALKNGVAIGGIGLALLLDGYFYLPVNPLDKNVATVAGIMMRNNIVSCYDGSAGSAGFFYYYPGVEYYYRQAGKTIEFSLAEKNSMRYTPLKASDVYDCIVYDTGVQDSSRTAYYTEIYRDPANKFKLLKRNNVK